MKSFNPPIRTLMGPGPSDVHPRILLAMARPTIGHLDPAFVGMMNETKEG
ncbi:MAG: alanine--glyoxylate aminotransferase family protein, partial [Candidatus Thioglobus sp.]